MWYVSVSVRKCVVCMYDVCIGGREEAVDAK